MAVTRFVVVAALAAAALAFSNTSPAILWASTSSENIDSLPQRGDATIDTVSLLRGIVKHHNICDYDAIVLVEQPGLRASDLRLLSPDTDLFQTIQSAPSSRQYPYILHHPDFDTTRFTYDLATKCRSQLSKFSAGVGKAVFEHDASYVIHLIMPHLTEAGRLRKETMAKHSSLLGVEISILKKTFLNHLVIFIGSPLAHEVLNKRRPSNNLDHPVLNPLTNGTSVLTYVNATLPAGGILKKYQLLTSELIVSLLIVLLTILPVVYSGLRALVSIQNPIRTDSTKTSVSQERKNQ